MSIKNEAKIASHLHSIDDHHSFNFDSHKMSQCACNCWLADCKNKNRMPNSQYQWRTQYTRSLFKLWMPKNDDEKIENKKLKYYLCLQSKYARECVHKSKQVCLMLIAISSKHVLLNCSLFSSFFVFQLINWPKTRVRKNAASVRRLLFYLFTVWNLLPVICLCKFMPFHLVKRQPNRSSHFDWFQTISARSFLFHLFVS